ncbi:MAG: hypothetical protein HY347_03235 [candidate division NC10 bacterium]|nr:hypothetical protein [candidate division NC10 bacterium]
MSQPSSADLRRSVLATVDLLRGARFRYMIIGGVAVGLWGRPRTTLDVDFAVLTDLEGLRRLSEQAKHHRFRIDREWAEWNPMARETQLRLIHGDLRIDLLTPADEHDREALRRRRVKAWHRRRLWFVAPEDLILQKLKVGRPRDFEDALSVFETQKGRLEEAYLLRWGRKLGIVEELRYLRRSGLDRG